MAYNAAYDTVMFMNGSYMSTCIITTRQPQADNCGTALPMAKTKNQAKAGHADSAQRSTAVNEGGEGGEPSRHNDRRSGWRR